MFETNTYIYLKQKLTKKWGLNIFLTNIYWHKSAFKNKYYKYFRQDKISDLSAVKSHLKYKKRRKPFTIFQNIYLKMH